MSRPHELDLSAFRGVGFQSESETWMSDKAAPSKISKNNSKNSNNNGNSAPSNPSSSSSGGGGAGAATSVFQVDEAQLANLVAMDFPREQCRWALFKCKNDPELAISYIFDHPAEPTESDLRSMDHAPVTPPAPAPPTDNNNNGGGHRDGDDDDDDNDNRENQDAADGEEKPRYAPKNIVGTDGAPNGYELYAMVSHMGRNAHSGHWIAHVKHPQHGWVIINDEKVAISQKTPFTHGSIYFYRRNQ